MKRFVLLLALGACVPSGPTGAFSTRFADNQAEPTAEVVRALPAPGPAALASSRGVPIAVATTHAEPRAVAAYDLTDGHVLWTTPLNAMTRPEILGDVVITSARRTDGEDIVDEVVALDMESGRELWRQDTESLAYVGAAREGDVLVYVGSLGAGGGSTRVAHIRAVRPRTGAVVWDHELSGVLGQPAIRGGFVFVPWERQNIAILGLVDGLEKARLRSTDDVIAWVVATNQGVFYGDKGIYRFDERSASGKREESTFRPLVLPRAGGDTAAPAPAAATAPTAGAEQPQGGEGELAPRDPAMFDAPIFDDGFFPKPGTRSARGRIRIYFTPDAEGHLVSGAFYFVYYRFVFGFGEDNTLRFARILPNDVIGAQVTESGLLTAGEQGSLALVDATTGNARWTGTLGAELDSIALDAATFAPAGEAGEAKNLRESLVEVAVYPDNRLVNARAYALQMLAAIDEPEITRDLLDLYAQRSMPGTLREAIGTALRLRRSGAEFLVQALSQHYDFIEGSAAPPLAIIVPSLLEMEAHEAVPGLVVQMQDHETPANVLPLVVRAITDLGDSSVVAPLTRFLQIYRADSSFAENPEALVIAAEGIFEHGGTEGRETLERLAGDATTSQLLATQVRGLFEREQHEAEQLAAREAQAAEEARVAAQRQEAAARPLTLSQQQINGALAEHADALRGCVMEELARNPELAEVRFVFIINGDGTTRDFTLAPNTPEFTECITPKLGAIRFPQFRQTRQRARFSIALRGRAAGDAPVANAQEDDTAQPWWVRQRARIAEISPRASAQPWWVRHTTEERPRPQTPVSPPRTTPDAGTATQTPTPTPDAGVAVRPTVDAGTPTQTPDAGTPTQAPDAGTAPPPDEPENPWWLPAQ